MLRHNPLMGPEPTTDSGGSTRSLTSRFRFLSWSDETYSIQEFIKTFPLPRVVRITNCEELNLLKALVLPADVDITQPLLLYKKYRAIKVQGKCLKVQKSGKLKEVGASVVIPDSFPGWFSLLSQDGKECAMMLTSLGQVAAARVPAFLTKFDVPVYKLTDSNESGGKSVYLRSSARAGSVLRLLGVWADLGNGVGGSCNKMLGFPPVYSKNSFMGGSLGGFGGRLVARSLSHGAQQPTQFQYVQCLSQENEVLFVPFSATGIFYPVAPRGGRNLQHVYPLSAIARTHRLPIRVKMVAGSLPGNIPDFTGILEIETVGTEDVILACTLLKEKPSLFELDIDSDVLLSQMTSEDLFIKSTSYQSALNFCKTEGDLWKRQIRTCPKRKGTISSTIALRRHFNKTLRLRSSPPPPSKLSLLFRPPSSSSFGSTKDPLRRTKSFSLETQSVSISLTQDEDCDTNTMNGSKSEDSNKRSALFNFMSGKGKDKSTSKPSHRPDVLPPRNRPQQMSVPNNHDEEVPYGRVLDEVDEEENIYAEITDGFGGLKLNLNPGLHHRSMLNYHMSGSNMSSLLKGGGGSDGAFSGTLSGTFSSSNPSSREEDIYDNVF